ncbi:hypothetical protein A9Q86_09590 [Flavobacteriales bacterium 33_180_T64]|nr:hypothetical protein A9Q86_09590 [Flavobacteriales bacterium 33_180_T64]
MGKKKKLDPNLIIAIGVLLASFAALFVYVQQASIMSEQTQILLEQSKSSAWPNLSIQMNRSVINSEVNRFDIHISNRGPGPAIIEKSQISYMGKSIRNWNELYDLLEVPDTIRGHSNDILYDKVIRPYEDWSLIDWTNNKQLMGYIYKNADKISIKICYKSVYNDSWQVERNGFKNNLEKNIRVKTKQCQLDGPIIFEE